MPPSSRRHFLTTSGAALAALLLSSDRAVASIVPGGRRVITHPTPRPGITAAKVPTREQLAKTPKLVPIFDAVRAIPEIIDGIRCNCGCAELPEFYSLLSCYEGRDAMALSCAICQGQATLAARLHTQGKSLDDIRAAIDAKFG